MFSIWIDTIDLQDQGAPSAKDHTRQPTHPAPLGVGPPAPHQAGALRQAEEASEEQQLHSPRVSDEIVQGGISNVQGNPESVIGRHDGLGLDGRVRLDEQAVRQNGGHTGTIAEDADMSDADGDDGLDDDMMDKISSSPSIDDGGYTLPLPWPARADSLNSTSSPSSDKQPYSSNAKVNTFAHSMTTPAHLPFTSSQKKGHISRSEDHHHSGGYGGGQEGSTNDDLYEDSEDESRDWLSPLISENNASYHGEYFEQHQADDPDFDGNDINHLLLPSDDPLLDNSFDDAPLSRSSSTSSSPVSASSWDNENTRDDDAEDISFSHDSRFIDSGWGGECLREIEDIDFEFVYALHTFFATVEGQANATKGDTMVLLDDSNSYWWLVRVVKDSSIGCTPNLDCQWASC